MAGAGAFFLFRSLTFPMNTTAPSSVPSVRGWQHFFSTLLSAYFALAHHCTPSVRLVGWFSLLFVFFLLFIASFVAWRRDSAMELRNHIRPISSPVIIIAIIVIGEFCVPG